MGDLYPIYEIFRRGMVPSSAASDATIEIDEQLIEQMGSKSKFWFRRPGKQEWLLAKYSRDDTGEHWSEKIACELARLLELPHARVELATHDLKPCVVVTDFRANTSASLLHGNELMLELDPTYPSEQRYRMPAHTVERIEHSFEQHQVMLADSAMSVLPPGVDDAFGLFVGYLMLDALIGNTDRHHENWGAIVFHTADGNRRLDLAPSYDHASSLGRELSDSRRLEIRQSSGNHGLEAYARRARSAVYQTGASRPLAPLAAFLRAGEMRPKARNGWLRRLLAVGIEALEGTAERLPSQSASGTAVAFAKAFLRYNYQALAAHSPESTP